MDPILGVLDEEARVSTAEVAIAAGDLLVLYSDGLTESRGSGGLYGEQRLLAEVRAHAPAAATPGLLLREVLDAVTDHRAGAPAEDDLTLLVARVGGQPPAAAR